MIPQIEASLAALDIQLVGEAKGFLIFSRGNCIAIAYSTKNGFSSLGSSGMMTEAGLAYLVWRGDRPVLVGKGVEQPADPQHVECIQQFSRDLKSALGLD